MTVIVTQERVSGSLNDITAPYHVYDDTYAALDAETATTAAVSQFNTDFSVVVTDYPYQQLSKHSYRVTCKYRPQKLTKRTPEPRGSLTWRFSYQQGSTHFTRSYSTFKNYGPGGTANTGPNFDRYINVIPGPEYAEAMGHTDPAPTATDIVELVLPNAAFTEAYRKTIMDLRGLVNSVPIFGRPKWSVRFVSASSLKRNDDDLVLSLGFDYRPPQYDYPIPGGGTIPQLDGHDYFWQYRTRKQVAGTASTPPYVGYDVIGSYVEVLYPEANLLPLLVIPGA